VYRRKHTSNVLPLIVLWHWSLLN